MVFVTVVWMAIKILCYFVVLHFIISPFNSTQNLHLRKYIAHSSAQCKLKCLRVYIASHLCSIHMGEIMDLEPLKFSHLIIEIISRNISFLFASFCYHWFILPFDNKPLPGNIDLSEIRSDVQGCSGDLWLSYPVWTCLQINTTRNYW